ARVRLLLEPDERDHLVDVARRAVVAGEDRVRLATREVRPQRGLLENDADPFPEVRCRTFRIAAEHAHLTGVAFAVALEDLDRRRLAGAVRPEQPKDLTFIDREVDLPDVLEVPVGLAQAADLDRMHPRRSVDGPSIQSRPWAPSDSSPPTCSRTCRWRGTKWRYSPT